ncbi:MAG: HAD-IIIA family hydrolase [Alphaproteobacteria bacterium]|nr:HAD-IIIA family hydrolase [Alphaproteobacteria bacterium]MBM3653920.1 HAD-IIIA family hydrolase [Alphaproteobacteria bacterium]
MIRQAVILCGGLGTRLGGLTAQTPKPLLPVGDAPFLDILVEEAGRQGFDDVLLLAGHLSAQFEDFARTSAAAARRGVRLTVSIEPHPAGTGGAIGFAAAKLAEAFVLMNGDSWFDVNLRALVEEAARAREAVMTLALREMDDVSRYGSVSVEGGRIVGFHEKSGKSGGGLVNGGVYVCRKEALISTIARLPQEPDGSLSLETDVLPSLVEAGRAFGKAHKGYFIDIGIPHSYAAAQTEIPAHLSRPAVFFDRDGVLNADLGHVGTIDRFQWIDGAVAAIRACNDRGYFVFVVTNQAGVAKGHYTEEQVSVLHAHMQEELAKAGAHIDDFRYCPYHVDATAPEYRKESSWRKPAPGMLTDVLDHWNVDVSRSFMIGDKESDMAAASAAGLNGHLFPGGNLSNYLESVPAFRSARSI